MDDSLWSFGKNIQDYCLYAFQFGFFWKDLSLERIFAKNTVENTNSNIKYEIIELDSIANEVYSIASPR